MLSPRQPHPSNLYVPDKEIIITNIVTNVTNCSNTISAPLPDHSLHPVQANIQAVFLPFQ
jgi:hypothetical protein